MKAFKVVIVINLVDKSFKGKCGFRFVISIISDLYLKMR